MILIEAAGGLGNQLQQYALYKKLEAMGADVRLDLHWFSEKEQKRTAYKRSLELDRLGGISYRSCTDREREALLGKDDPLHKVLRKCKALFGSVVAQALFTETEIYHPEVLMQIAGDLQTDLYLRGFFACEYYYADVLEKLRAEIFFPAETDGNLSAEHREKLRKLKEEMWNTHSVSLHLRRGDYLDQSNTALFGGICTDAYYEAAIRFALAKLGQSSGEACFYLFSDDPAYAEQFGRTHLSEAVAASYQVVDLNHGENSLYDIDLMRSCQINICANSTFSFWGARLNLRPQKEMLRPTIHKNTQRFCEADMRRWWEGWSFVSPEGVLYDRVS